MRPDEIVEQGHNGDNKAFRYTVLHNLSFEHPSTAKGLASSVAFPNFMRQSRKL